MKKKTATLEALVAVRKSPKLLAEPRARHYGDFDTWLAVGDELVASNSQGCAADDRPEDADAKAFTWPDDLEAQIAAFDAGCRYYNRRELYSSAGGRERILRRVVAEQVSLLIGSFPNAVPHNAKVYSGMLVEEIIAAEPSAVALESACRIIRRSKKFPPAISEVLDLLHEQEQRFVAMGEASDSECWKNLGASLGKQRKAGPSADA